MGHKGAKGETGASGATGLTGQAGKPVILVLQVKLVRLEIQAPMKEEVILDRLGRQVSLNLLGTPVQQNKLVQHV